MPHRPGGWDRDSSRCATAHSCDGQCVFDVDGAGGDSLGERLAFHQFHDDGVAFEAEDLGDVRIQGDSALRFRLQASHVIGAVGERGG
ncbi:MAG TPA: hypothetical protein VGV35_17805 [Bryobacteraceae bacterium]|nr:hypothetical protein [Bryobacteraceae bacterium]